MSSQLLCLMGPHAGQLVSLEDDVGAAAIADGWAREVGHMPYDSTDVLLSTPMWSWPKSLVDWLKESWLDISDSLPPDIPFSCPVQNISPANPAVVKVSSSDFANFAILDQVKFAGTGNVVLDDAGSIFTIQSMNNTGKTFKIDCDLSGESSSITTGTVTIVTVVVSQNPLW